MSNRICLNCLREFKVRKGSQGKYCSHQCFCAYEHANKSHNCMGVGRMNAQANNYIKNKYKKKNLGVVIDELDVWKRSPKERAKIKIKELTPKGKQNLKEALELQLKFLKMQIGETK